VERFIGGQSQQSPPCRLLPDASARLARMASFAISYNTIGHVRLPADTVAAIVCAWNAELENAHE